MIDPGALASCLWKPFVGDISSGGPVYFTFSAELVKKLLLEEGYPADDPVLEVCDAARQLYCIAGDEAVLREDALKVGTRGHSRAIVLVCQQVLAVESMVRDPNGYSENAYFPRLRRLMSPVLGEASSDPFDFAEFEAIWRALARDIRSLPGSSDTSITFRFGVESGVNKARAFPLSQALLTLEDLRIVTLRSKRQLEKASPADIWRILKQVRYYLSRRARRLIDLGVFRERVADQVLNYYRLADTGLAIRDEERARQAQIDVFVFRDTSDWLEPVYRAYLRAPDSTRDHDEARIRAELATRITGGSLFIFPLTELGDSWLYSNRLITIKPEESFLVVGEPAVMADVGRRLRQLGIDSTEPSGSEGAGGSLGPYLVIPRKLAAGATEVTVRSGRASSVGHSGSPASYHWHGGLAVDGRGSKFLSDYLPTHVEFSGDEIPFGKLDSVNGRHMSAESFISLLSGIAEDTTFEIGFPRGRTARLSVAVSRLPKEPGVGHAVGADGSLEVGLVGIAGNNRTVSGFFEASGHDVSGFDIRACLQLLRALRAQVGEEVLPASLAKARVRLQASKIPEPVRDVMLRLLIDKVRLPSRLCVDLGIN